MHISLKVEGMHCDGCARSVEKAASSVAGVSNVSVDLKSGAMSADVEKAGIEAQIASAIEDAGFDVVPAGN